MGLAGGVGKNRRSQGPRGGAGLCCGVLVFGVELAYAPSRRRRLRCPIAMALVGRAEAYADSPVRPDSRSRVRRSETNTLLAAFVDPREDSSGSCSPIVRHRCVSVSPTTLGPHIGQGQGRSGSSYHQKCLQCHPTQPRQSTSQCSGCVYCILSLTAVEQQLSRLG